MVVGGICFCCFNAAWLDRLLETLSESGSKFADLGSLLVAISAPSGAYNVQVRAGSNLQGSLEIHIRGRSSLPVARRSGPPWHFICREPV